MADEKKEYEYRPFEYNVPWDATGKYNTFTPGDAYNTALTNKQNAESAYTNHVGDGYTWANQQMLNDAITNWQGRNPFSYDFNTDAMYQQYKDKYIKQGKMAMQDTMGQAAAMTGGYGSSYASTAGNQAYQASLENLNDIIPQLYQMAYDRYNQEGQDMLNNISLLQSERGFDYGVWGDKANMLANDRGYYQTEANNLWNRDFGVWDSNRTFDRGVWESDRSLAHSEHTNKENVSYSEFVRAAEEKARQNALVSSGGGSGSSGGGYSSGGSTGGNAGGGTTGGTGTTGSSSGLNSVKTGAAKYKGNNSALADYLAKQCNAGAITEAEMDAIFAEYMTPEKADYSALNQRNWVLVDDGGINWFGGIDNNAVVKDQYGNRYRADDLVDELVKSGMSKNNAKTYVKNLLAELDK